ncbi:DUF4433 domain-containing protein [Enterovibrio sp. ZSDZ42]|uniref:DUF4433 domain-containing protein n=1 Tax=Enterovibrio gelatinilyticus TaxID=2899819 RepID=A0ABT5QYP9_9GAMM|nr:DarT ssDNA thymidine ADP-ribosyltransferase family protein [Enterovibrio sp. ZSDZ42]MDD1793142.1 DUF4433 domain-containing protein [Enterovibrio sp. ZSDZ42]
MNIELYLKQRGIISLFHFTTIENYMSILERGHIYSRAKIEELRLANDGYYTADYTDSVDRHRLDGLPTHINLSISRPNWYLLCNYMRRPESLHLDWCILELNVAPLLSEQTLFSVCNAASNTAKHYGIRGGVSGLSNLFADEVKTPRKTCTRVGLPSNFTTDIQAEALVFEAISIEHIRTCHLPSEILMARHKSAFNLLGLNNHQFSVNDDLFKNPMLR